jgi:DNA helicase-2/ATP-dependent DNA helicase PcrA
MSPEQVLGLTFTRKAAGELAHRVRVRLGQLRRHVGDLDGEPTIGTYHSFGARIVTEHGLRSGFEPSSRLLTEASCWQLADEVVRTYNGDMIQVEAAPSTVAAAVRPGRRTLRAPRDPDELASWTGRFLAIVDESPERSWPTWPKCLRASGAAAAAAARAGLSARKQALEAMDFGDQMSRAARVARDPSRGGRGRARPLPVVLLDEYQGHLARSGGAAAVPVRRGPSGDRGW